MDSVSVRKMMLIAGFCITVKFHIWLWFDIIFPNAVDYDMHMDIATSIMTVSMCADKSLMSRKVFSCILTEYVHRAEKKQQDMTEHEKCLTNGTYERARESGTEQNYDMIDGCVNNVPKKPRRIGGRWSVLDRLHIKQAQRKQKDQTQQQQQQERSRKN